MGNEIKYIMFKSMRDNKIVYRLKCPFCSTWGELDDDQFNGRVSIDCANSEHSSKDCTFHKTINLKELMDKNEIQFVNKMW